MCVGPKGEKKKRSATENKQKPFSSSPGEEGSLLFHVGKYFQGPDVSNLRSPGLPRKEGLEIKSSFLDVRTWKGNFLGQ